MLAAKAGTTRPGGWSRSGSSNTRSSGRWLRIRWQKQIKSMLLYGRPLFPLSIQDHSHDAIFHFPSTFVNIHSLQLTWTPPPLSIWVTWPPSAWATPFSGWHGSRPRWPCRSLAATPPRGPPPRARRERKGWRERERGRTTARRGGRRHHRAPKREGEAPPPRVLGVEGRRRRAPRGEGRSVPPLMPWGEGEAALPGRGSSAAPLGRRDGVGAVRISSPSHPLCRGCGPRMGWAFFRTLTGPTNFFP